MTTPNPGSLEARELGCTCPVMDNGYGYGSYLGEWIYNMDCSIHFPQEEKMSQIYKLIEGYNYKIGTAPEGMFVAEVNDWLGRDWQLHGPTIITEEEDDGPYFYQAMTFELYEEEKENEEREE